MSAGFRARRTPGTHLELRPVPRLLRRQGTTKPSQSEWIEHRMSPEETTVTLSADQALTAPLFCRRPSLPFFMALFIQQTFDEFLEAVLALRVKLACIDSHVQE